MRITRNTDGAIMLIAVLMAMISIGALYYLLGLGDALLAQERMQDAADASAFSSAVIHARGMNLLAMINIIMAALLAILVLLSMLAAILRMGARILTLAAFLNPPFYAAARALYTAADTVKTVERSAEPEVKGLIKIAHSLQGPLATAIPMLAAVNSANLSKNSYGPLVSAGTTFPILEGLPTQEGDFDRLCTEAGKLAGALAVYPLSETVKNLPGAGYIAEKLVGVAKRGAAAYARYYCGSASPPSPPSVTQKTQVPSLVTTASRACDDGKGRSEGREDACQIHIEELAKMREAYSEAAGSCSSGAAAQDNANCDVTRAKARTQCSPQKLGASGTIVWRHIKRTRHFKLVVLGSNKYVVEGTPTSEPGVTEKKPFNSNFYPLKCDTDRYTSIRFGNRHVARTWNLDPSKPLCETEVVVPTVDDFILARRASMDIEVNEVTDILSCTKLETVTLTADAQKMDEDMKASRPQEMCNCAAQGESMFQIRSIVLGDAAAYTASASQGILVASSGTEVATSSLGDTARIAGKFAAAQAEYYFDGDETKPELWMWNMKWKARMRRLSMTRPSWDCPAKRNTCPGASDSPSDLEASNASAFSSLRAQLSGNLDSLLVH